MLARITHLGVKPFWGRESIRIVRHYNILEKVVSQHAVNQIARSIEATQIVSNIS